MVECEAKYPKNACKEKCFNNSAIESILLYYGDVSDKYLFFPTLCANVELVHCLKEV